MTDNLDRLADAIIAAALRDDQDALRDNLTSLIVTYRQLQNELECERADNAALIEAWRQMPVGSMTYIGKEGRRYRDDWLSRSRPGAALLTELDAARMVIESLRSRDWETVDRAVSYYKRVTGKE